MLDQVYDCFADTWKLLGFDCDTQFSRYAGGIVRTHDCRRSDRPDTTRCL